MQVLPPLERSACVVPKREEVFAWRRQGFEGKAFLGDVRAQATHTCASMGVSQRMHVAWSVCLSEWCVSSRRNWTSCEGTYVGAGGWWSSLTHTNMPSSCSVRCMSPSSIAHTCTSLPLTSLLVPRPPVRVLQAAVSPRDI